LLLARMIFGECEDCSKTEKIAIAFTALNRTKKGGWYGENLKEVILKPYQYSCFNSDLDGSIFLKDPLKHNAQEFLLSLKLSKEILEGKYKDPTKGATHYYNPKRVGEPYWTKKFTKIGKIENSHHIFYR